jgi:hypothetical protein
MIRSLTWERFDTWMHYGTVGLGFVVCLPLLVALVSLWAAVCAVVLVFAPIGWPVSAALNAWDRRNERARLPLKGPR